MSGRTVRARDVDMIAGGSGITPLYQLARAILAENDKAPEHERVRIAMLFANSTAEQIAMRDELDALAKKHADTFRLTYIVSHGDLPKVGKNVHVLSGHIDERAMVERLYAADPYTIAFVCGPPGLVEVTCLPGLESIGHSQFNIYAF
jgi:ferredoxin-NADP reductase